MPVLAHLGDEDARPSAVGLLEGGRARDLVRVRLRVRVRIRLRLRLRVRVRVRVRN